jgi:hypothetical protein
VTSQEPTVIELIPTVENSTVLLSTCDDASDIPVIETRVYLNHDLASPECAEAPVPVTQVTWGMVKARYRK